MRLFLVTLCLVLSSVVLNAAMNVKTYQDAMPSPDKELVDLVKTYVQGLGEGMSITAATSKGTPLFCVPGKLALSVDNYLNILDGQIKSAATRLSKDDLEKMPIGILLLLGLQETFPCTGK